MINVIARVVAREYWENVADNLSEAGWSWGASQRLISTGGRSGLQTHVAVTGSVTLCVLMTD
jgi:hypothetical protein